MVLLRACLGIWAFGLGGRGASVCVCVCVCVCCHFLSCIPMGVGLGPPSSKLGKGTNERIYPGSLPMDGH